MCHSATCKIKLQSVLGLIHHIKIVWARWDVTTANTHLERNHYETNQMFPLCRNRPDRKSSAFIFKGHWSLIISSLTATAAGVLVCLLSSARDSERDNSRCCACQNETHSDAHNTQWLLQTCYWGPSIQCPASESFLYCTFRIGADVQGGIKAEVRLISFSHSLSNSQLPVGHQ